MVGLQGFDHIVDDFFQRLNRKCCFIVSALECLYRLFQDEINQIVGDIQFMHGAVGESDVLFMQVLSDLADVHRIVAKPFKFCNHLEVFVHDGNMIIRFQIGRQGGKIAAQMVCHQIEIVLFLVQCRKLCFVKLLQQGEGQFNIINRNRQHR